MKKFDVVILAAACALFGCTAPDADELVVETVMLGPVDGRELPPTDLERVQAGDIAPDFTLLSLAGPPVALSDYRGEKNVVLVFYRGYW